MNPLGGHIGSDGDGLGPKQPELFDIHVMIFCGDPEATVEGLARFFAIDREAAVRLVEDVPIIVKRAAEPDVAAEMVDVLGGLGAQVVLLPAASAVPPETDLLELKTPSIAPSAMEREPSPEWGALESMEARPPPARPARRAATVDMLATAPMAELEISPSSKATVLEARAPARSNPPDQRGVIDDELVIAPLYEPGEARSRARGYAKANAGVSLPPAPLAAPPVAPRAPVVRESLPPALGEPMSSAPPPVIQPVPSVPALPDLGLGSVPPLPKLGAMPPAPPPVPNAAAMRGAPPRVPPPSPRPGRLQPPPAPGVVPAAAQQRALYERTLEHDSSAKLPSLGVSPTTTETRAAAARPAGADNYWSGRRAAAGLELGEVEPEAPRAAAETPVSTGGAAGEAMRGLPVRPMANRATSDETSTVRTRSAGRALIQVVAGLVIFGFFMQQGNSIVLGNADVVSIVLHGIAFFSIGVGLAELRG